VTITEGITIRELAEKLDVRAKELLKNLLDRGVFASINQALDVPTATTLAESFSGVVNVVSLEEEMVLEVAKEETKESLKPRPRCDGDGPRRSRKTSLLDAIREADVAAAKQAASRSTSGLQSGRQRSRCGVRDTPVTKRLRACAREARRLPISWCWSWPRMTASCRKRRKRSTRAGR